ncbi:uncharacterized protein FIBRA_07205 [Fibroporia radiculosa]|uniref:Sister chromatid cohesion protein DCC1 n=1 Tax=Fibroporia radiculosa TaxID=599839 RepID=J4IBP2_9APHY|nr:uncharacterized protein FIBRA_07205 [Fibroporia radiculosa]CCM05006.1 predicted protein [Fibroporia radiculosa]
MELPPDLCKLIEAGAENAAVTSFKIKGSPEEDAVLCTPDKTYAIRSVVLSNSVLVVTPGPLAVDESGMGREAAVIRDQLSEILELVPSVPKLHKLDTLLRGAEYGEEHEDEDGVESEGDDKLPRQKLSYQEARDMLQASDAELDRGLRERRILILDGRIRPIAPSYLTTILELILTHLVSLSLRHDAASVDELSSALEEGYDIRRDVCEQILCWFGQTHEKKWRMDVNSIVKEVGLGILRSYEDEHTPQDEFMQRWRKAVGDSFEAEVSLNLLSGNYLSQVDTLRDSPTAMLTYFPSSRLPIDPSARFTDLFLTRPRWKAEEIAPFLADIVVDSKERDRLLLKYTRAVTDSEGVWYTARTKYNG